MRRPLNPYRGILESLDSSGWKAVLREAETGNEIVLGGGPGLAPLFRDLLGAEIEVWGRDTKTPDGQMLMVYGIDTVPSWQPPAGIPRNWSSGIDVSEWLNNRDDPGVS